MIDLVRSRVGLWKVLGWGFGKGFARGFDRGGWGFI